MLMASFEHWPLGMLPRFLISLRDLTSPFWKGWGVGREGRKVHVDRIHSWRLLKAKRERTLRQPCCPPRPGKCGLSLRQHWEGIRRGPSPDTTCPPRGWSWRWLRFPFLCMSLSRLWSLNLDLSLYSHFIEWAKSKQKILPNLEW